MSVQYTKCALVHIINNIRSQMMYTSFCVNKEILSLAFGMVVTMQTLYSSLD